MKTSNRVCILSPTSGNTSVNTRRRPVICKLLEENGEFQSHAEWGVLTTDLLKRSGIRSWGIPEVTRRGKLITLQRSQ